MTQIDFIFAIGSRYSYLAHRQLDGIARDHGVSFRWRPVTSIALMRQARGGTSPFDGPPPAKQYDFTWRKQDAEAWAELYGIPFRDPHHRLKYDSAKANHACVAADRLGRGEAYARALFPEIFVADNPSLDRDDYIALGEKLGIDGFAAALDDPQTAATAQAIQDEAVARGSFGVPTFLIDDRIFWGNDRLVLLRHYLAGRA
ncbi:2-hydroxychromene-2-carboxylate isomerase [Oleomonas cavernae]|nr:2-hydroxychromene-2-carboxylate isomerase [Oleomonas cavernae]